MLFTALSNPLSFLFYIAALIMAITIHEFAHAYMADRLGDPTPRIQGRLTLNPLAHLDPLGTILLFLVRFGWGKPVQFDPFNLRNPRRDGALISLAGPASNILLAGVVSILLRILGAISITNYSLPLVLVTGFLEQLILLNVILAVFNLVPIHPLDGFKIVLGMLPPERAREWAELERYGMFFLLFILFPIFSNQPLVYTVIGPIIGLLLGIFLPGASF